MKKTLLSTLALVFGLQVLHAQSIQKVLIEEHTGAWCGYCPDGALILEDVLAQHPNAIAASVHNGDAMYISTGGIIQNFYNPAYPQATINRESGPISRGSWASAVTTALQNTPVVSVSIDSAGFEAGTRTLKVKVKATFLEATTGNLRMNLYLTEDNVVGSGSGYDQTSYFNTQVGHPLYGLGNPILNYTHNHVFRYAAGGAWGNSGIIPASVAAGDEFYVTYTKVIPATWDINNLHIIGMVNLHGTSLRPILNAEEVPFSVATGIFNNPASTELTLQVSPNPLQSRSTISFNLAENGHVLLEVYNLAGQKLRVLADDITNSGMHSVYWDGQDQADRAVPNGMYILRLTTEDGTHAAQRILVNR